jgi:hypothetical protein
MTAAVLYFTALLLAIVELTRARGQSLLAWAIGFLAVGLLWNVIGL